MGMASRAIRNTNSAVRSIVRFILSSFVCGGSRSSRLIRLSLLDDGAEGASVVIHKDH